MFLWITLVLICLNLFQIRFGHSSGVTIDSVPLTDDSSYDVIVVGGGAAGCSFASQLVRISNVSVLLIERGKSNLEMIQTLSAETWPNVVNSPATEALRFAEGTWGAIGKVLGGGTSVNDGLFLQETDDFFVDLFNLDSSSLETKTILSDIKRAYDSLGKKLASPISETNFASDMFNSFTQAGIDPSESYRYSRMKQGTWKAFSTFNTSSAGTPRLSSADLIHQLDPKSILGSLTVKTEHLVQSLIFNEDHSSAIGVMAQPDSLPFSKQIPVYSRAVVLAAGAIMSPQLLQVSGVGPSKVLQDLKVDPILVNENVGANFVDRLVLSLGVLSNVTLDRFIGFPVGSDSESGLFFEVVAGGEVASQFAIASLGLSPPEQRTVYERGLMEIIFNIKSIKEAVDQCIEVFSLQENTYSRGSVTAKSRSMSSQAAVEASYFKNSTDLQRQVKAFHRLLDIIQTDAFSIYRKAKPIEYAYPNTTIPDWLQCIASPPHTSEEIPFLLLPCPPTDLTDSGIEKWLHRNVLSSYHYFGSLSFGTVVDPQSFQLLGMSNLLVIDASVYPNPTRVNPQATIMAIGQYAAEIYSKTLNQDDKVLIK